MTEKKITVQDWESLNSQIKGCGKCGGLNDPDLGTQNAPGYGDTSSNIVIVGQSLCGKPCIESQIPFTGGSGILLDKAFTLAGVRKSDVYLTNVVKCHPPNNRPSFSQEKTNCIPYLKNELEWINPTVIICLGKDAWESLDRTVEKPCSMNADRLHHFFYHPSYIARQPKAEREIYIEKLAEVLVSNSQLEASDILTIRGALGDSSDTNRFINQINEELSWWSSSDVEQDIEVYKYLNQFAAKLSEVASDLELAAKVDLDDINSNRDVISAWIKRVIRLFNNKHGEADNLRLTESPKVLYSLSDLILSHYKEDIGKFVTKTNRPKFDLQDFTRITVRVFFDCMGRFPSTTETVKDAGKLLDMDALRIIFERNGFSNNTGLRRRIQLEINLQKDRLHPS